MDSSASSYMPSYNLDAPTDASDASDATLHVDTQNLHRRLQFHAIEVSVSYLVMLLFSTILLKYTAFVSHQLAAGDLSFTPKAILPTFRALLWTLAVSSTVFIGFNVALILAFSNDSLNVNIYTGLLYAGRHFVLVLAPAFLYQKSLARAALWRASAAAFVLAFGALPLFLVSVLPTAVELGVSFCAMVLFFVSMALWPAPRASPRVLRWYAAFALIHLALASAHVLCMACDVVQSGSPFSSLSSVWLSMTPLFVWQLLTSDTTYWRGRGSKSLALQRRFAKQTKLGEHVSAEGLHILIEMHRKHVLDFSSLDVRRQIGSGLNATIYSGLLRARVPVSIKVYTPGDLSDAVITEFSQEAALCGNLEHPNIIRFYGLSICPPTISLVFELCRASLADVSKLTAQDDYGCKAVLKVTQMLDAARAIAYLHSFSPPFIHRELQLSSFLVDAHGVVKLSGFGDSRLLHQFAEAPSTSTSASVASVFASSIGLGSSRGPGRAHAHSLSVAFDERTASSPHESFEYTRKVPFHAPYSERIDVYALGLAFWQLLHPTQALLVENASNNPKWRPRFDASVPLDIVELVTSTWRRDPSMRPTAAQLVRRLEAIQLTTLDSNLECVATAVHASHLSVADAANASEVVSGADAVRNLISSNQVAHAWEAVRLGNAWMETGLLHDERHAAPFENKNTRRYYFAPAAPRSTDESHGSDYGYGFGRNAADSDDDNNSVLVIGMSMSTRASYTSKFGSSLRHRRRPKRCACKTNARQVATLRRRQWHAFATAESRAIAQNDYGISASFEDLLTSTLLESHDGDDDNDSSSNSNNNNDGGNYA